MMDALHKLIHLQPMRDPVEDAEALATMIAKDWHNDQFREHISDAMLKMFVVLH